MFNIGKDEINLAAKEYDTQVNLRTKSSQQTRADVRNIPKKMPVDSKSSFL